MFLILWVAYNLQKFYENSEGSDLAESMHRPENIFKGRKVSNSIENGRILPINNPIPLIPNNNMYAKFENILCINTQVIDRKQWARTDEMNYRSKTNSQINQGWITHNLER